MQNQQRRTLFTADARFAVAKAAEADKPATLTGYAVVWNRLSSDRGYYRVRFKPNSAIFANPADAYFHHDPRLVIGTTEDNERGERERKPGTHLLFARLSGSSHSLAPNHIF